MTRVAGRCPMGCGETLFLGDGGHVTCSHLDCLAPCAVDDLLHDPHAHEHVVTLGEGSFDIQHPLAERGGDLVECLLHQHLGAMSRPPFQPGRYAVGRSEGGSWVWQVLGAEPTPC
ncbi:MAG: DUF6085 family protein [Solirubrobacteraceae bacterium]|nr:DUF6085 family protein [Solirubrobacteraceae bacterium]